MTMAILVIIMMIIIMIIISIGVSVVGGIGKDSSKESNSQHTAQIHPIIVSCGCCFHEIRHVTRVQKHVCAFLIREL